MLHLFYYELKKFFNFKWIKLTLLILTAFVLLCVLGLRAANTPTVFDFQVFILKIIGEFYILSFFLSLSSYTFGIELDAGTLKIIRAKSMPASKIYLAKFLTSVVYAIVVCLIIYIITLFFGVLMLPVEPMKIPSIGLHFNTVKESFLFTTQYYINQLLASTFIITLTLLVTIMTYKKILAVILVPVTIAAINMLSSIRNYGYEFFAFLLPINSDNIYDEYLFNTVNERLLSLFIYSSIFIVLGIYFLKNKEVKE